jgi:hypothetical protein
MLTMLDISLDKDPDGHVMCPRAETNAEAVTDAGIIAGAGAGAGAGAVCLAYAWQTSTSLVGV